MIPVFDAHGFARSGRFLALMMLLSPVAGLPSPDRIEADDSGTMHLPAFAVPPSGYISAEAGKAFRSLLENPVPIAARGADIATYRALMDKFFYAPRLEEARKRYPVTVEEKRIGGVRADVVLPQSGIAASNRDRVLINLHGGGFRIGAGMGGLLESVPIAGVGKIKVISVDYRQGPEFRFPAASEDVAAVYRALLTEYKPENIGIYGCSAGGVLTAEAMAWFDKEQLPMPGAIGIFCAPASILLNGDSRFIATALDPFFRAPPPPPNVEPLKVSVEYFAMADAHDPLVSPDQSASLLAKFPPTLLITGTRDAALSAASYSHTQLVKAGVDAELHVWEGMWHGFMNDATLPESREVFEVVVKFFGKHLGHGRRAP